MTDECVTFSRRIPMTRDTGITADSLHANGVIVINNFHLRPLSLSRNAGALARDDLGIAIEHASRTLNRIELFLDH